MKIDINENGAFVIKELYNPIILETWDGEKLTICMRDSGFELDYITEKLSQTLSLKKGEIIQ